MTVKDRLRKKIEQLSDDQAADALQFVESRLDGSDPLDPLLGSARKTMSPSHPKKRTAPKVAALLAEAEEDLLAFYRFPRAHSSFAASSRSWVTSFRVVSAWS